LANLRNWKKGFRVAEAEARYREKRLDRGIKVRADTIYAISSYREIFYLVLPRAFLFLLSSSCLSYYQVIGKRSLFTLACTVFSP
jgi:branched-chain amino acid transport system permease protein